MVAVSECGKFHSGRVRAQHTLWGCSRALSQTQPRERCSQDRSALFISTTHIGCTRMQLFRHRLVTTPHKSHAHCPEVAPSLCDSYTCPPLTLRPSHRRSDLVVQLLCVGRSRTLPSRKSQHSATPSLDHRSHACSLGVPSLRLSPGVQVNGAHPSPQSPVLGVHLHASDVQCLSVAK